ncbi:MAG TPA: NADH-quinone oxidoreductase subunit NuoG [Solirubrobacterales bacterium]|nr:NADH-quinone oxidoreductase subunit NuoG [Solirubrobacterales bacterium]
MSEPQAITFVVNGIEVEAPEGTMLVDAAKRGDVEIPVFCYEPKLGPPVGACRMCLVEIEGIPKLQTACSTPVRDGMVVYTQTDRVSEAQNAVVEFLLVNHPLDCPVCDKGGECPLQDIAMGWGPGRSRFSDPKRHFQKPATLSPLVRIDRERCILCYRCVRFSQDVAEDEQLQLLERGAASYVGTYDDRPYIAPFHGNIIELCPVGALTSEAYRFRARPWDIEDAGSVCTLCPAQCNVKFTVRDEVVQRVLARDNTAVDDGWLCDKGRFGFQMIASDERITAPLIQGAAASWGEALELVAERLRVAGPRTAAIVGGGTSNEEGYLVQRIVRESLGSADIDSRGGGPADRELLAGLAAPELGAAIPDIDRADSVLVIGCDPVHAMPILDLRLRKAMRLDGTRVVIATERPTTLDGGAEETARYAPGEAAAFCAALATALGEGDSPADGEYAADAERIAGELRPGSTVIIWGERVGHGPDGTAALASLLDCARSLRLGEDGAGLLEVPDSANGRGLREVGCLPCAGPGFTEVEAGRDAAAIRDALSAGELDAVLLINVDPVRDLPGGPEWAEALRQARFVLSISGFENESATLADVILPAESYAEKEGTVTHPDGRLQRLRPSIPHPGDVRPGWQWLVELSARLGDETGIDSAHDALRALADNVPYYAGVTHEEIGAQGIRWQERQHVNGDSAGAGDDGEYTAAFSAPRPGAAGAAPAGGTQRTRTDRDFVASPGEEPAGGAGGLRLGTYRSLWSGEVPERNPALRFLSPHQTLEVAPADAELLGIGDGDEVEVRSNGTSVRARVALRERVRPGAAFLIEGTADQNANALAGAETVAVEKVIPEPVVVQAGGPTVVGA